MRIIAIKRLKEFWKKHPDSEQPLRAWYTETLSADWKSPNDIKNFYRTASILKNNRVVFNIKGNDYRLIVAVNYFYKVVYIRFIGTHQEYNKINAEEI
ncbi:MAG: type II toxin-antitoxin system HigB family toxin [Ignavibacterium sp.]